MTGPNAPQEKADFLSGHVPTPLDPKQSQNKVKRLSRVTISPIFENTHKWTSYNHTIYNNKMAEAIGRTPSQQRPITSAIKKPASTSKLIFGDKIGQNAIFDNLFHTMLEKLPEMTKTLKINHFYAHLRKEAIKLIPNKSATNKTILEDVLIVFRRKYVKLESWAFAKHKWNKPTFDPNKKITFRFLEELIDLRNEYLVIKPNKLSTVSYTPKCHHISKGQLI